jgi:hypothetical protein
MYNLDVFLFLVLIERSLIMSLKVDVIFVAVIVFVVFATTFICSIFGKMSAEKVIRLTSRDYDEEKGWKKHQKKSHGSEVT